MKYSLIFGLILIVSLCKAQQIINPKDTSLTFLVRQQIDTTNLKFDVDSSGIKIFYKDSIGKKWYYFIGEESSFDGGVNAWKNYLENNLNADKVTRKLTNNKMLHFVNGVHKEKVTLIFTVCSDGSLCDFQVEGEANKYAAEEALRIIKKSPNWKPAAINGVNVKSKKKQSITFVVQQE